MAFLPNGESVLVHNQKATLIHSKENKLEQSLYIPGVKTVTKITFSPSAADVFTTEWQEFIQSIELRLPEVKNSSSTGTGAVNSSTPTMPCGGSAGILCKSGFYCFITDAKENIGLCKAINK